ncbi:MAG: trigger factor [Dehalococcoidia bacterium]|nr:trigger factor [Dehalococcoidia bacterium]
MKVTLERLPESRVLLEIEVDEDRLSRSLDAAYKRLAPRARVPGFRPGKAPRPMIEKALGRARLMDEALNKLIPDAYNEALASEEVDAIAQPELEIVEIEPVRFKATVPVRPTVSLGDYRALRVDKEETAVTDEMVAEQLLLLRRRHALHVPVARPVQWNDVLIADVRGTVDGDPFVEDEDAEFALREGQLMLVPGLAETFLGMSKGEEKQAELPIPADFRLERLQGKTAAFVLHVKEVKEEQLPDEDDEFASSVNAEEFPTFAALEERVRTDLEKAHDDEAEAKLRNAAVDRLVAGAALDFPAVLVEREIDHLVQESTGNDVNAYRTYLQRVGRTEAEYREALRETATQRVCRSLVLNQLAADEQLDVSGDEIEQELDRLSSTMGAEAERFRQLFTSPQGIGSIGRNLMSQKTLDRLAAVVKGEAPELPAPAAEPAPAAVEAEPAPEAAEEETA